MSENKVTLTILIEKSLKKRFKRTVYDNDDTVKKVVTEAIINYLDEYEVV